MNYLNKIQNFDKLLNVVKALDGYFNPNTAISITKAIIKEMTQSIKKKYKLNNEETKNYELQLKENVLTRNGRIYVDEFKFNNLIKEYKEINQDIKSDKKSHNKNNNFFENNEPLNLPDNEESKFEVAESTKFKKSAKAVKIIPETNITHVGLYFSLSKNTHLNELRNFFNEQGSFKAIINVSVEYKKISYDIDNNKREEYSTTIFSSSKIIDSKPLLNINDIEEFYKLSVDKINNQAEAIR